MSEAFERMVARLRTRLCAAAVEPAFFSLGRPGLEEKAEELVSRGYTRIMVFPYFLFNGNHVVQDIPEQLQGLRRTYPQVSLEMLPSLEDDPLMDELVFERLWEAAGGEIIRSGRRIEKNSLEFIREHIPARKSGEKEIAARVVHATADFSFARNLRFSSRALTQGKEALAAKTPVFCDVRMLEAAMTGAKNTICLLDLLGDAAVPPSSTRAATAVDRAGDRLRDSIVVVGNSPTSLWALLELWAEKKISPALVIGLPVGFVGAAQAKESLLKSGLECIANVGPRGGSPAAAAAFNALCRLEER